MACRWPIFILNAAVHLAICQAAGLPIREEGKIYNSAPSGTAVTLDPGFRAELLKYRGCFAKITGGHSDLVKSVRWSLELWNFETTAPISLTVGEKYELTIGFYCADGNLRSFSVRVNITTKNQCQPKFPKDSLSIYAPADSMPGTWLTKISAEDADRLAYNAHVSYSLVAHNSHLKLDPEGDLFLTDTFDANSLYESINATVRACDDGSPKLCVTSALFVFGVTVTAPQDVTVNTATLRYQIIDWTVPLFGQATAYKVQLVHAQDRAQHTLHARHVTVTGTRSNMRIMLRAKLERDESYAVIVSAVDQYGVTPAQAVTIHPQPNNVSCAGRCKKGGAPACYQYGHGYNQYADDSGQPQCICFPGYQGIDCAEYVYCPSLPDHVSVGALVWAQTKVNATCQQPCPYGPSTNYVLRYCDWDRVTMLPEWAEPNQDSIDQCWHKQELISRLDMYASAVHKQSSADGNMLGVLHQMLLTALPNAPTDLALSQSMLNVFGAVQQVNWGEDIDTQLKHDFRHLLVNYTLSQAETLEPTDIININPDIGISVVDGTAGRYDMGVSAFIELPSAHVTPQRLAIAWMRNSTFYPASNWGSSANPVLEILPMPSRGSSPTYHLVLDEPLRFGMFPNRAPDHLQMNRYECAYYSEAEHMWKMDGVSIQDSLDPYGYVLCETHHLTAFTIMESFTSVRSSSFVQSETLIYVASSFGCSLMLIMLLATTAVHCLRHSRRCGIVNCLCLSAFILYSAYCLASSPLVVNSKPKFCSFIGVLVQWAVLSVLMWLCVEAANLHRLSRRLLITQPLEHQAAPCAMLRKALLAWGVPGIIVTFETMYYGTSTVRPLGSCGPPPSLVFYYLPALLMLCINSILFVSTALRLNTQKNTAASHAQTPSFVNLSFIRYESTANFLVCVLCCTLWAFESLSFIENEQSSVVVKERESVRSASRTGPSSLFCVVYLLLVVLQGLIYVGARIMWRMRYTKTHSPVTINVDEASATAAGAHFLNGNAHAHTLMDTKEFGQHGQLQRPLMYGSDDQKQESPIILDCTIQEHTKLASKHNANGLHQNGKHNGHSMLLVRSC